MKNLTMQELRNVVLEHYLEKSNIDEDYYLSTISLVKLTEDREVLEALCRSDEIAIVNSDS